MTMLTLLPLFLPLFGGLAIITVALLERRSWKNLVRAQDAEISSLKVVNARLRSEIHFIITGEKTPTARS